MGPEALDVDVEGLGVAHIVRTPHPVDEGVSGEDAPCVLDEQHQELEFLAAQVDLLTPDEDPVAIRVDPDTAHLEHPTALGGLVGGW